MSEVNAAKNIGVVETRGAGRLVVMLTAVPHAGQEEAAMLVSVVIPVLNEAQTLPLMMERLRMSLRNVTWEVIFVDDGSTDETYCALGREAVRDERVKVVRFSRNFGHQAAVTAGLDFANGDAVVVMDRDLQDHRAIARYAGPV